jgi:hypothetical protein
VEKELSYIEMMNRFSKPVFFCNKQEFIDATKPEQEKIILCRRFIPNSIVLWKLSVSLRIIDKSGIYGRYRGNDRRHSLWYRCGLATCKHALEGMILISCSPTKKLDSICKKIFEWKYKPAASQR